ncbi:Hypothetical_protein [Hexamita inflata]|uniref:Hypothetical_protein n=1 Tax=Hexamita inflata TaxID=28002 RepID=A0AA86NLT9_9EUKA|nr:Hypothetical protein HINF_LOCUS8871 [Hexamita inflata]
MLSGSRRCERRFLRSQVAAVQDSAPVNQAGPHYVGRAEEASVRVPIIAGVGAGVAALVRAFVQEDLGGLGVAVLHTDVAGNENGLGSVAGVLAKAVFGELG